MTYVISVQRTPDSQYPEYVIGPFESKEVALVVTTDLYREATTRDWGYDPFFLPLPLLSVADFWKQADR